MSINSTLKKEGIIILEELDTLKVNTISANIASKLCLAFPEHGLNRSDLFASLCRINMYVAQMPMDLSGAKYFYKNNSIYFNENLSLEEMSDMAVHECIHFIQEIKDSNNNILRMGLYNLNSGLGINEAAVQIMSSEANMHDIQQEKYYNINLNTISPNYYPLQCAIINQMIYFTGTYPLYHSTLNSNDIFKNTFISLTDKKTYYAIEKNLDQLLSLENDLHFFANELQYTEKISSIRLLNYLIDARKKEIINLFFKTQNLIIKKCFTNEFNSIRNEDDLKEFYQRLYDFKDILGVTEDYTFYHDFYCEMMIQLDNKRSFISEYGEINLFDTTIMALTIVNETKNSFAFVKTFISKLKKLFDFKPTTNNINDF